MPLFGQVVHKYYLKDRGAPGVNQCRFDATEAWGSVTELLMVSAALKEQFATASALEDSCCGVTTFLHFFSKGRPLFLDEVDV